MSNDITIPPEALEAAAIEIAPHPWSMYTDAAKDHFRHEARAACLAMLRAWPGVERIYRSEDEKLFTVILPLPKEKSE